MRIRTLSLWQPWASAIALGLKTVETRAWVSRYHGPLAIHAAQKKSTANRELFEEFLEDPQIFFAFAGGPGLVYHALPYGAIVGLVRMRGCEPAKTARVSDLERMLGDFSGGRWAWRLENARALVKPFPVCGRQGFFWVEVPDRLLPVPKPGECRRCGCTEGNACVSARGRPCHFVAENLCSACAEERP